MVFYATFNNISVISWRLVLLVEETGVHGENLPYVHFLPDLIKNCLLILSSLPFW